jgi:ketosteroid isomerase-like protein
LHTETAALAAVFVFGENLFTTEARRKAKTSTTKGTKVHEGRARPGFGDVRHWCALEGDMRVGGIFVRAALIGVVMSAMMTARVSAQSAVTAQARSEIESVLKTQQEAWNKKDLDGFMKGYWNSPDLTFFSGDHIASGWQGALERYRKTYQSAGKEMGTLDFYDLRIEPLGADSAFVRGAWHLTMTDGKTPHGLFTLVFHRFPEGWKVIHDHTSAAE